MDDPLFVINCIVCFHVPNILFTCFKNYIFIINIFLGETLQMENEVNYADLPDELFEQIETFIKTEIPAPGDILVYTIFCYNFDS